MKHDTNFEESKVDVQNRVSKKKEQKQKKHIWWRTHLKGQIRGGWFCVDRWMLSFLRKPSIFSRKKKEHERVLFKWRTLRHHKKIKDQFKWAKTYKQRPKMREGDMT